ncbi:MAG TPA: succinate dehydrogenase, cytochrome b556 subunit [Acidobacteriota bacterium]|jgi:succinate dehydrogenase / fumarate reductase cytochrome b subunit|nr:succinate dehydrogenase, cytochrome b556 subunit [Acidobacteriota bacterium]
MRIIIRHVLDKYRRPYSGTLAWLIQRVTGILLLFYLLLHVRTVHKLSEGPDAFNAAMALFRHPFFKLLEIALLGTVILHALNGLRITLIDLGIGQERQRELFWGLSLALGALVFLAGAIPIFLFAILKI